MLLIFISSGLFLGWSLGANDAANVFGSAVGARMITFRRAAVIASLFVIIGAVVQGSGTSETLAKLSEVKALAGAFTVSLCAGVTVYAMTRSGLPVSTTQSIVGAIIGWSIFSGSPTDYGVLITIVGTWVSGPILGLVFAALLFLLLRWTLRKARIHIIKLDAYIRLSLVLVGAFGAYSLGANNIANVMGVFVGKVPEISVDLGLFSLDSTRLLFLFGGIAIAIGIYTYSHKVMKTVGNGILDLSPEAAIVVVLAQALVLFLFSSTSFSLFISSLGLPRIPMVPVSSTQVVVGSVLGIGIIKGAREIKIRALGSIALGWVTTPLAAGILTYFALFFVQNVFGLQVTEAGQTNSGSFLQENNLDSSQGKFLDLSIPGVVIPALALLGLSFSIIVWQRSRRLKAERELARLQARDDSARKAINGLEISTLQLENNLLTNKLEAKRKEYINIALNISAQKEFIQDVAHRLDIIRELEDTERKEKELAELSATLRQKLSFTGDMEMFYAQIDQVHKDFRLKLNNSFPGLTDQEKRLAILLRLNLSTKEIAPLLGISAKSVEIARYRLRKRLEMPQGESLTQFIQNL
jgi:phosphate/sulfate permease/DNA-directed RNA polymerase specialized sigma24 family protein